MKCAAHRAYAWLNFGASRKVDPAANWMPFVVVMVTVPIILLIMIVGWFYLG